VAVLVACPSERGQRPGSFELSSGSSTIKQRKLPRGTSSDLYILAGRFFLVYFGYLVGVVLAASAGFKRRKKLRISSFVYGSEMSTEQDIIKTGGTASAGPSSRNIDLSSGKPLPDGKKDDWVEVENRPWANKRVRKENKCLGEDFVKHHNLVPMRWYWSPMREVLQGMATFPMDVEGPPGRAHGASIAMVFDEVLAYPVWRLIDAKYGMGVTAKLSVSYKAALPLGSTAAFQCRLVKKQGRKWWVTAELTDPKTHQVFAIGEALFVSVELPQMACRSHL